MPFQQNLQNQEKSLEELLFINKEEKKIMEDIKNSLNSPEKEEKDKGNSQLRTATLSLLFKLSEGDEEIEKICQNSELNLWWKQKLKKMAGDYAASQFAPISPFSALKGYFLFHNFNMNRKISGYDFSPLSLKLLEKACTYQIFIALQKYCDYARWTLQKEQLVKNILTFTQRAIEIAELYSTPGCIEASHLTFEIGCYYAKQEKAHKKINFVDTTESWPFFFMALEYLYRAEYLSETSSGARAISHAYPGKALTALPAHAFTSWKQAKEQVISIGNLLPHDVERAQENAKTYKRMLSSTLETIVSTETETSRDEQQLIP